MSEKTLGCGCRLYRMSSIVCLVIPKLRWAFKLSGFPVFHTNRQTVSTTWPTDNKEILQIQPIMTDPRYVPLPVLIRNTCFGALHSACNMQHAAYLLSSRCSKKICFGISRDNVPGQCAHEYLSKPLPFKKLELALGYQRYIHIQTRRKL